MGGLNCNWSAIAQEAFAHAVEVERLKGTGQDVEAGLARLRAGKHKNSEREQAEGYQHGMNWALEDASYDELVEACSLPAVTEQSSVAEEWLDRDFAKNAPAFLGGMKKVSKPYARGYLQGAAEVLSKI